MRIQERSHVFCLMAMPTPIETILYSQGARWVSEYVSEVSPSMDSECPYQSSTSACPEEKSLSHTNSFGFSNKEFIFHNLNIRMDHFQRKNWSSYNLYGFPVTYFVAVVFLSIMWLAITSPITLQPGNKHRINEDDQFKNGC